MNPHTTHSTSLISLLQSFKKNSQLILQMTYREVMTRYKGSSLGLFWSFFNPVIMLVIYTFVFSVIFKSRWGNIANTDQSQFAVILFTGLMLQNLFAEVINRAPLLIFSNVSYVKKVIFPLEILPIITTGAALFHYVVSLGVLLAAFILFNGYLHWTVLYLPLILLPFLILILGLAWILVSLGVFIRDMGQTITIMTTVLLFLSPIFYPITAVPVAMRPFIQANPLTFVVNQAREVLIWGHHPNWIGLIFYTMVAIGVAWIGYAWFQKTKKGFADAL